MNIIHPVIVNPIKLSGYTIIEVFSGEDKERREPLFHWEGENSINDGLKDSINLHAYNNTTTNTTSYHLTTTNNWFTDSYPDKYDTNGNRNSNANSQDTLDGIFVNTGGTATTGYFNAGTLIGDWTQAFLLHENTSSSVTTNVAQWVAESTWKGTTSSTSDDSSGITAYYMGKNFSAAADLSSSFGTPMAQQTGQTAVTLTLDDVIKVTWTITIGS